MIDARSTASLLCAGEAQINKSGTTSQVIAHPKGSRPIMNVPVYKWIHDFGINSLNLTAHVISRQLVCALPQFS